MSSRKSKRASAASDMFAAQLFHQRIEAERRRIFSAMGIIDCCRCLHEYLPAQDDTWPDIACALVAAHELLDHAAGELGCIADEDRARKSR